MYEHFSLNFYGLLSVTASVFSLHFVDMPQASDVAVLCHCVAQDHKQPMMYANLILFGGMEK